MALRPLFQRQAFGGFAEAERAENDVLPEKSGEKLLNKVLEIPVAAIAPNPDQPRVIFDDYELSQLAVSIQQNGLLQPLTVRKSETGSGYELISGERRLRACKLLNAEYVPCIVMETDSRSSAVLAVIENIQRADLNYIEEALAFKSLIDHYALTQEDCAARLGIAQSTVANKLRLLRLTDEEKALVLRYRLNERQARALLKLPSELRAGAVERISQNQLNTAQTDKLVEELLTEKPQKPQKRTWAFKQVGLYINTFNKTIDTMKKAGINCEARSVKNEDYIEYVVKINLHN